MSAPFSLATSDLISWWETLLAASVGSVAGYSAMKPNITGASSRRHFENSEGAGLFWSRLRGSGQLYQQCKQVVLSSALLHSRVSLSQT